MNYLNDCVDHFSLQGIFKKENFLVPQLFWKCETSHIWHCSLNITNMNYILLDAPKLNLTMNCPESSNLII